MSIFSSMNSMLKNHYEKIILVFLLIAFAILLFVQIQVVQVTQNKQVDDKIGRKEMPSDYEQLDFANDPAYKDSNIFSSDLVLTFRDDAAAAKSDASNLMIPFRMAECVA